MLNTVQQHTFHTIYSISLKVVLLNHYRVNSPYRSCRGEGQHGSAFLKTYSNKALFNFVFLPMTIYSQENWVLFSNSRFWQAEELVNLSRRSLEIYLSKNKLKHGLACYIWLEDLPARNKLWYSMSWIGSWKYEQIWIPFFYRVPEKISIF